MQPSDLSKPLAFAVGLPAEILENNRVSTSSQQTSQHALNVSYTTVEGVMTDDV